VSDFELVCLALALRIRPEELLPKGDKLSSLLPDFFGRLDRSPEVE